MPFHFRGLYTIGCVVFIFNLVLFIFNVVLIAGRFVCFKHTFKASILHPTESLFTPAIIISLGTILLNIEQYGLGRTGPWLDTAVLVLFWFYCALAVIASCGIYLTM